MSDFHPSAVAVVVVGETKLIEIKDTNLILKHLVTSSCGVEHYILKGRLFPNQPFCVIVEGIAIGVEGLGFPGPGRYNRTRCRQGLATAAMFLRSCSASALSRKDGPHHSLHASA